MIYPDVPIKDWLEKNGIVDSPIPCAICKYPLPLEKPIAFKGYRGAKVGTCPKCKANCGAFKVVPVGDEREFWEQFRPEGQ